MCSLLVVVRRLLDACSEMEKAKSSKERRAVLCGHMVVLMVSILSLGLLISMLKQTEGKPKGVETLIMFCVRSGKASGIRERRHTSTLVLASG